VRPEIFLKTEVGPGSKKVENHCINILSLESCKCARMRFHCANGLMVPCICAP